MSLAWALMPVDVRSRPWFHGEPTEEFLEDREILGHIRRVYPRVGRAPRLVGVVGGTWGRLSESNPSWAADRIAKHGTRQGSTWVDHVRSEWYVTGADVLWFFRGSSGLTCRGKRRGNGWDRYNMGSRDRTKTKRPTYPHRK